MTAFFFTLLSLLSLFSFPLLAAEDEFQLLIPKEEEQSYFPLTIGQKTNESLQKSYRPLNYQQLLEQVLRENFGQQTRALDNQTIDLNWDNTFQSFWFPNPKLTLFSDEFKIFQLYKGSQNHNARSAKVRGGIGLFL